MSKRAVCIMSGGMDSTLSAYMMKARGYEIIAVHFNYDQRTEGRELRAYRDIIEALGVGSRSTTRSTSAFSGRSARRR